MVDNLAPDLETARGDDDKYREIRPPGAGLCVTAVPGRMICLLAFSTALFAAPVTSGGQLLAGISLASWPPGP